MNNFDANTDPVIFLVNNAQNNYGHQYIVQQYRFYNKACTYISHKTRNKII